MHRFAYYICGAADNVVSVIIVTIITMTMTIAVAACWLFAASPSSRIIAAVPMLLLMLRCCFPCFWCDFVL